MLYLIARDNIGCIEIETNMNFESSILLACGKKTFELK